MDHVQDGDIDVGGLRLALRRSGPACTESEARRPVLLVHGLASNSQMWDGVARRLGAAGHPVVAIDQRGHGRSDTPADGYDTDTCADDLATVIRTLGWVDAHAPVVAGQSWGGNVVLSLAARHTGVAAAIALVDGGWLRPAGRFATFDECWRVLAPPSFAGLRHADLAEHIAAANPDWPAEGIAGTLANFLELEDGGTRARLAHVHHRSILHSLWLGDPRALYPRVRVPVLLMPAGANVGHEAVNEAARLLPDSRMSAYVGAHHDLHAQHPDRCAHDLRSLAGLETRA